MCIRDRLIDMLGPDIDCEDDTEFSLTEGTSSQEQEYTIAVSYTHLITLFFN